MSANGWRVADLGERDAGEGADDAKSVGERL
jgi:hypothetical protein